MTRISKKYKIPFGAEPDLSSLKEEQIIYLNSNEKNNYSYLAIGTLDECKVETPSKALYDLQQFIDRHKDWSFGYLSYELKDEIEPSLDSGNKDGLEFPLLHFIVPRVVCKWREEELELFFWSDEDTESIVQLFKIPEEKAFLKPGIALQPQISAAHYLRDIMSLKHHIQQGDIYEVNYCMQFAAEEAIEPFEVYRELNRKTLAPFSTYVQTYPHYLLCASPERYIKKEEDRVISQPIKGTKKRSEDPEEDEALKVSLRNDPKERSENIMITDLVRNDLSKSALKGSVHVDELCEIYSFRTVHQMISTVSAKVESQVQFTQLIKDTFPMGSMTGAPKVRAMDLIESHEQMRRGVYSGAVGYITPDGDFDFNVVIRSLLYNAEKPYLAAMVGGAITSGSNPESEYEECLLKAKALLDTLN